MPARRRPRKTNYTTIIVVIGVVAAFYFMMKHLLETQRNVTNSEMKHLLETQINVSNSEMKHLMETQINVSNSEIKHLRNVMNSLNNYVRRAHDFEIDHISILEKVTHKFGICGSWVTSVDIVYKGRFTTVSVSHADCSSLSASVLDGVQSCAKIDMSFSANHSCPNAYALDLSEAVQASGGTKVVSFGWFGTAVGSFSSSNWVGHVASTIFTVNDNSSSSSVCQESESCSAPFIGCSIGHKNSIIVNGDQMDGMSGSLVVSERGIIGMSIATLNPLKPPVDPSGTDDDRKIAPRHRQVFVTPLSNMQECLDQHLDLLATDCPRVQILKTKGLDN